MYRSIIMHDSIFIENRTDSRHNAQNNSWGNFSWTKTTNTEYRHGRSKTSHRSEWQRTADVNLFQHWSSSTKSSSATQRQRTTEVRKINHRDLIDAGWETDQSRDTAAAAEASKMANWEAAWKMQEIQHRRLSADGAFEPEAFPVERLRASELVIVA